MGSEVSGYREVGSVRYGCGRGLGLFFFFGKGVRMNINIVC